MYLRVLTAALRERLRKPYGLLLLGPRQVGKTTLLERALRDLPHRAFSLADYAVFQEHLKDASLFRRQCLAALQSPSAHLTVFIDEVQKLPRLLDDCQALFDSYRGRFRFIATGSSARKLRQAGANLLPGRAVTTYLHPLTWQEASLPVGAAVKGLAPKAIAPESPARTRPPDLEELLLWGCLPGILSAPRDDRADLLRSYALAYLKEEIQAEALVRSLEGFSRFLELAALESGNTTNYQKLAKDVGLKLNTVKNYYSILVDTMVAVPLEPYLKNARKKLISTPKLYFFDTGVRNAAAGLALEPSTLKLERGRLFEHAVVLELYRRFAYDHPHYRLYFWRSAAGAEVDLVVDTKAELIPIEIKSAASSSSVNLRGLTAFMDDYSCRRAYVIGDFREPERLDARITAIPWRQL